MRWFEPRVAIVIAAYNYGQFIGDALDSCRDQTYKKIDVIVVDDGSTDNTATQVAQWKAKNKFPVKYIYQKNSGAASARNNGIENSRSTYIICLDADDKLAVNYVEECVNIAKQGYDIVKTPMLEFGNSEQFYPFNNFTTLESLRAGNSIHCASLFSRNAWRTVHGYDTGMWNTVGHGYEDWELWLSMVEAGFRVGYTQNTLLYYRKHGPSMITQANKNHDAIVNYIRVKHGY